MLVDQTESILQKAKERIAASLKRVANKKFPDDTKVIKLVAAASDYVNNMTYAIQDNLLQLHVLFYYRRLVSSQQRRCQELLCQKIQPLALDHVI